MSDIEVTVPDQNPVEDPASTDEFDNDSGFDNWEEPPRVVSISAVERDSDASSTNGDSDDEEPVKGKRYRASKAEMEGREKVAIRLLQQAPTTINSIAKEAKLPYPKAAQLVQRLVEEGRVSAIGRDSNKTLYRLDPKVAVKSVRQLPDHSFTSFLDHFHIGQQLKVVGFHMTEEGHVIDVRIDDNKVVKLQAVES